MKHTPEQVAELKQLVAQLRIHQGTTSDAVFCARYRRFIGSSKTWSSRLVGGDLEQVNVKSRLSLCRQLIAMLEGGAIPDRLIESLPFNAAFQQGLERLEAQAGTDRRILCVLGGIGVGKTVSVKIATRESNRQGWTGKTRFQVVVPEALRESKVGLLTAIARRLGCGEGKSGAAAMMEAIKAKLAEDVTVIFDEAHQGGVMLMRIIKDLVNHTNGRFVYVALKTEYMRVVRSNSGSIEEAKQFVRRCMQPVLNSHADGTIARLNSGDGDATIFLHERTGFRIEECRKLATEHLSQLRSHGNLSSLSDAVDMAETEADEHGVELTPGMVAEGINVVCPRDIKRHED